MNVIYNRSSKRTSIDLSSSASSLSSTGRGTLTSSAGGGSITTNPTTHQQYQVCIFCYLSIYITFYLSSILRPLNYSLSSNRSLVIQRRPLNQRLRRSLNLQKQLLLPLPSLLSNLLSLNPRNQRANQQLHLLLHKVRPKPSLQRNSKYNKLNPHLRYRPHRGQPLLRYRLLPLLLLPKDPTMIPTIDPLLPPNNCSTASWLRTQLLPVHLPRPPLSLQLVGIIRRLSFKIKTSSLL